MERSRQTRFADKLSTRVWLEQPAADNPYLAQGHRCHGYDLQDLVRHSEPTDLLFLMLKGELPDAARRDLLRRLLVGFCSPGPRHPASRAVMNAAASGTDPVHLLPIGLSLYGGAHHGAATVAAATRFIASNLRRDPAALAQRCMSRLAASHEGDDVSPAPGFGSHYGDRDPWADTLAGLLAESPGADRGISWGRSFARALDQDRLGLLPAGVAAAACVDLGLPARSAALLFQLAGTPGLLAHGLETAGKTIQDVPFLDESCYQLVKGD